MFVPNLTGTLIQLEEDPNSRFRFEIWFDYTKQAMNLIREGAMLAVPNFASTNAEQRLSILEVTSILPVHYALGEDTRGYPAFVVEAARSAVNDWEEQETEATEDVTKIRCLAIPTNLEMVQEARATPARPPLQEESNLPMVGSSVRLLNTEFTEYVANYGIRDDENTLVAGALIRDSKVRIRARVEDLLRTHFGIFGFTGAGKSNLVSTLVNDILSQSSEPVKILCFDLMGEYTALLADQLVQRADAMILALGDQTLPQAVLDYFLEPNDDRMREAVRTMRRTTVFPRALLPKRGDFAYPLRDLLQQRKIRIYRKRTPVVDELVDQYRSMLIKGSLGNSRQPLQQFLQRLQVTYVGQAITQQTVSVIIAEIDSMLGQGLVNTAINNLTEFRAAIQREGERYSGLQPLPRDAAMTVPELVRRINDPSQSGLYVIQSADPDELRQFSWLIGTQVFEQRRRTGQILPLASFVFDEADEFIPQQATDSYAQSADIAMTLARRGRKFGLGIGIATQRVRYLNTSIMAQPHTYFVSKMPRQTDRQVVAEAFGVSEDMFRQTFKFKKGDWLLMSHDATGMEAIPLPIHCEDANQRIMRFLDQARQESTSGPADR